MATSKMGNVALTLLTLLLLQLLAAAGWALGTSRLRLFRHSGWHWAGYSLLSAAVLALVLAREAGPAWLTVDAASVLAVAALLAARRGLLLFLRQEPADLEALLLLSGTGVLAAWTGWLPEEMARPARIALNSSAMAWVLLRTAMQSWPPLRSEFGETAAFAILAPMLAGASLFLFRLCSLLLPFPAAQLLPEDNAVNVAVALVMLLLCVLLQGSLAGSVALRTVNKLRRLSQRDSLTGLLNRAEWLDRLDAQHRWLGRFGESFALLMIDVDHFKAVNDSLGHAAGDAVLIAIAQVLSASAREVDVVGRLGGEEFCVLLPRADAAAARRTAERLRRAIGDTQISWRGHPIGVTVSIGLAVVTDAGETPQQMLDRADRALYHSKRSGRNRTSMAPMVAG